MKCKTIYIVTQLKRHMNEDVMQRLFDRMQAGANPTGVFVGDKEAAKQPMKFARIFHAANTEPTRTACILASRVGDPPENKSFGVSQKGASKGSTVVPTQRDLRELIYAGDSIMFAMPDGMDEDDVDAKKYGKPLLVENVYKESVELADGLQHKVTNKMNFTVAKFNRAVKTNNLDISTRLKGACGFMRHQLDGSIFVLTKGDLTTILPLFFNCATATPGGKKTNKSSEPPVPITSQQEMANTLVEMLKTQQQPWALRLTFSEDNEFLPDPELLTIFWSEGSKQPFKSHSMCGSALAAALIFIVFVMFLVFLLLRTINMGDSEKTYRQLLGVTFGARVQHLAQQLTGLARPLVDQFLAFLP